MFFIFGVVSGLRDLGIRCCTLPCCGTVRAILTCSFHQFTLFFIPLFRFRRRYFLTCPYCGSIYELSKEEGRRLEREPHAQADPTTLRFVRQNGRHCCPYCGCNVEWNSRYCPQCGTFLGGKPWDMVLYTIWFSSIWLLSFWQSATKMCIRDRLYHSSFKKARLIV